MVTTFVKQKQRIYDIMHTYNTVQYTQSQDGMSFHNVNGCGKFKHQIECE